MEEPNDFENQYILLLKLIYKVDDECRMLSRLNDFSRPQQRVEACLFALLLPFRPCLLMQRKEGIRIASAMAFDHPVEADRVDLSFTSIMARAPVIGSLMYLIGGQNAKEEDSYDGSVRKEVDLVMASESQTTAWKSPPIKSALKKRYPSLAPTDDSDSESFQSALD